MKLDELEPAPKHRPRLLATFEADGSLWRLDLLTTSSDRKMWAMRLAGLPASLWLCYFPNRQQAWRRNYDLARLMYGWPKLHKEVKRAFRYGWFDLDASGRPVASKFLETRNARALANPTLTVSSLATVASEPEPEDVSDLI